jgi:hypothetical protein
MFLKVQAAQLNLCLLLGVFDMQLLICRKA